MKIASVRQGFFSVHSSEELRYAASPERPSDARPTQIFLRPVRSTGGGTPPRPGIYSWDSKAAPRPELILWTKSAAEGGNLFLRLRKSCSLQARCRPLSQREALALRLKSGEFEASQRGNHRRKNKSRPKVLRTIGRDFYYSGTIRAYVNTLTDPEDFPKIKRFWHGLRKQHSYVLGGAS